MAQKQEELQAPLMDDEQDEISLLRESLVFEEDEHFIQPIGQEMKQSLLDYYIIQRIRPGSIKGSMFTLTTAVVGAGILAVPYAIQQVGFLLGIGFFILGGVASFFSLHMLVLCSGFTQGNSYKDLAMAASGRGLATFTQLFVCLNLFGTSIGYLVGGAELIPLFVEAIAHNPPELLVDRTFLLVFLTGILVYPLALFRSLAALRFTSLFATLCISYLIIAVVIQYYIFRSSGYAPTISYQLKHLAMYDFTPSHLLTAIPLVVFAYTCHPNVLPIYIELQRPSPRRMYKVMARSLAIAVLMYTSLGAYAVLTFGDKIKSNFLVNDYHHAPLMLIGCVGFSVAVVITVPLFIHTLRANIIQLLWGNLRLGGLHHGLLTTSIVAIILVIAITTSNIASVLGVLGATSNPMICYILPSVFLVRLAPAEYRFQKAMAILLSSVLVVTSVLSLMTQFKAFL